ncbi:MAG TPA: DUF4160 domain-containing protein [Thermoanaerobaculia bacterium]|nr:DUF4160 domain-containing protein [Thermoanaerobaculia bacterium]
MPTVLFLGPYRFFFYSNEGDEPVHVHVRRDRCVAKLWLEPISIDFSTNFASHELREIRALVLQHRPALLEAWNEHFGR